MTRGLNLVQLKMKGRKRSASSCSNKKDKEVPLPPSRSAPTTWRKPRRDVGDRVFVSSPTKVYFDFIDENLKVCNGANEDLAGHNEGKLEDNWADVRGEEIRSSKDLPKIRSRIFEDSLESQELNFYIGIYHFFLLLRDIVFALVGFL